MSDLRFPGFQNSFAQSSPKRSPSKTARSNLQRKGKEKEDFVDLVASVTFSPSKGPPRTFVFDDSGMDDSIQDYDAEMTFGDGSPRRRSARLGATKSIPEAPHTPPISGVELSPDYEDAPVVIEDSYKGVDWREEV
jgi:hypothetical protein